MAWALFKNPSIGGTYLRSQVPHHAVTEPDNSPLVPGARVQRIPNGVSIVIQAKRHTLVVTRQYPKVNEALIFSAVTIFPESVVLVERRRVRGEFHLTVPVLSMSQS